MQKTRNVTLIVMGVSGVGKTSVARALSQHLPATYVEADELHPDTNIAAMRNGTPLTDEMRQPWLRGIAAEINRIRADAPGASVVVACSALKKSYRNVLRAALPDAEFVYLSGTRSMIHRRMAQRRDHFMPPELLDSQLATLEPPSADEAHIAIDASEPKEEIVAKILAALSNHPGLYPEPSSNTR